VTAVGLVGAHGYAASHLRELDRLADLGKARLVAVADIVPPDGREAAIVSRLGAQYIPDWRQMVGNTALDVVVIASPPHLHAEMSLAAVEAGVHVLLEKPPVVAAGDFERLSTAATRAGVLCQVGFQSMGSGACDRLRGVALGRHKQEPVRLVATGEWQRDRRYWARSEWAGKESLHGVPVRDGALSNPFAHAVMNCLMVGGAGKGNHVSMVEVERYRANDIEVEDTACTRVRLTSGGEFSVAVTLCAEKVRPPALFLESSDGSATWSYEGDTIDFSAEGRTWQEHFDRRSLLEELLAAVAGEAGTALTCPLESTRSFVEFVEAVHSEPVRHVPGEYVRWEKGTGGDRAVIAGVGEAIGQARQSGRLFGELAVPWAIGQSCSRQSPAQDL